jgi:hypothetical protein
MEPLPSSPSTSWDSFLPVGHLSPFWSALLVYVAVNGLLLALLVVAARAALREHRRTRFAPGVRARGADLRPGPASLLGTILDDGRGAVAHVVIRQILLDRDGVPVMWEETARELRARPFVLVLADGTKVPVVPTAGTRLVASATADRLRGAPGAERTLSARVEPGAAVLVSGELVVQPDADGALYRDAAGAFALSAGAREPLTLNALPREERAAGREARAWALALALAFVGLNAGLFRDYHVLCARGVHAWAMVATADGHAVADLEAWRRAPLARGCVPAHDARDCRVELWLREPGTARHVAVAGAIPREAFGLVVEYPIARVPVLVVPGDALRIQVGEGATVPRFEALAALVLLCFALGVFVLRFAYPAQPWYRQRRVTSPA